MVNLFLDSSNKDLTVGLAENGQLLDEVTYEAWQRQSELLIPELEKMLNKHNLTKDDIVDVSVGIGPGSYTGVRISLTVAKVMANIMDIPLFAISSLEMLKDGQNASICLINARSNRSYCGVYLGNQVIVKDCVMSNADVLDFITKHPDFTLCGDLEYLGLVGKKSEIVKSMMLIKSRQTPIDNKLGLTPVYLKD